MNATGFYQGQLVPIYPANGVYPLPAATPGALGKGTGPATLPSQTSAAGLGGAGAALDTAAVNTGLPVWVFVIALGAVAYILLWKVFS